FDHYVKGVSNGVENKPAVEVESPNGQWTKQSEWPAESTLPMRFYLNSSHTLSAEARDDGLGRFVDAGKRTRLESMVANPKSNRSDRLAFISEPLAKSTLLSGTPRITMELSVLNR